MKYIFLMVIKAYKRIVSPVLPPSCRFYPTCSDYAYEAFSRHGVIRGGAYTLVRISKCHPFNPGGYDPVP